MSECLLTEKEMNKVVKDYVREDFPVNSIRLDRGHWEDITLPIAKAQAKKLVEWLDEKMIRHTISLKPLRQDRCLVSEDWQTLHKEVEMEVKNVKGI